MMMMMMRYDFVVSEAPLLEQIQVTRFFYAFGSKRLKLRFYIFEVTVYVYSR